MKTLILIVPGLLIAALGLALWPAVAGAALLGPPPIAGNWKMMFNDDFAGTALNSSTWAEEMWGGSGPVNGVETYSPTQATISGGDLDLTAVDEGSAYISGQANTGPILGSHPTGYSFTYGYVQASIKLVSGAGLWPAFWMLPDPNSAQLGGSYHDGDGEIDIMEELGAQPTIDQVHLHLNGSAWGEAFNAGVDLSQGFHTYAVNWEPGYTTWYLDGKAIYTLTGESPDVPEYLILNLGVGGPSSWGGAPASASEFPATMQIGDVQVYQQSAALPEPSAAAAMLIGAGSLLLRRRERRREYRRR